MTASTTKIRITSLIAFLLLLILFLAILATMVLPYLLAVVMGCIFAVLSHPFYQKLRRRRLGPRLAAALVTIGMLLIVIVPLGALAYTAVREGQIIFENLQQENLSFEKISQSLGSMPIVPSLLGTPDQIESQIRSTVTSGSRKAGAIALAIATALPDRMLQIVLSILSCFFFLMDGRRFLDWVRDKIPLEHDVRATLIAAFRDTTVSVIWAIVAAAGAQALLMSLAFCALGIPAAVLAGGATFILAWIPVLGSTPVWIAGAIYLYMRGSIFKVVLMIVIGLVISVTDNVIRPLILKGRSELHALVSLVAIFGGIDQFGIFGVFYGPILAAVVLALLNVWPAVGQRFGLLSSQPTTLPQGEVGDADPAPRQPDSI